MNHFYNLDIDLIKILFYFRSRLKLFFWRSLQKFSKSIYSYKFSYYQNLGCFFYPFDDFDKNNLLIIGPSTFLSTILSDFSIQLTKNKGIESVNFCILFLDKELFTLLDNKIIGMTRGYMIGLVLIGVGYRFESMGDKIFLRFGTSNSVIFPKQTNECICHDVRAQSIKIYGLDKNLVHKFASKIQIMAPLDIYKKRGIFYG